MPTPPRSAPRRPLHCRPVLAAVGALLLAACGDGGAGDVTAVPPVAASPTVRPAYALHAEDALRGDAGVGATRPGDTLHVAMDAPHDMPTVTVHDVVTGRPLAWLALEVAFDRAIDTVVTDTRGAAALPAPEFARAEAHVAVHAIGVRAIGWGDEHGAVTTSPSAGRPVIAAETALATWTLARWRDLARLDLPASLRDREAGGAPTGVPGAGGHYAAPLLTALPVPLEAVEWLESLGGFDADVGGAPLGESRWHLAASARGVAVRAPAYARVLAADAAAGRIVLRVHDSAVVAFDGVQPSPSLAVGALVTAGSVIGGVRARVLGMRVLDARDAAPAGATLGATAASHAAPGAVRWARFAASSYAMPWREALYARVDRAAPDLDGRAAYDVAGRLAGTWYDAADAAKWRAGATSSRPVPTDALGLPMPIGPAYDAATVARAVAPDRERGDEALTFGFDARRPGEIRVAIGAALRLTRGDSPLAGVFATAWEAPDPGAVALSAASAVACYPLHPLEDADRARAPLAAVCVAPVPGTVSGGGSAGIRVAAGATVAAARAALAAGEGAHLAR